MIYVLSDIHGNRRQFNSVLEQIDLQPTDTLYILGDVIDRHPDGIRILREIMDMPNAKMLLGNHELMMLNALGYSHGTEVPPCPQALETLRCLWHHNGGEVTHEQFNALDSKQQTEIIEFLQSLPLSADVTVNGTIYKLVHAAPPEEYIYDSDHDNATEFAVWKRWRRPNGAHRNYTLVFGHSTTDHYQDVLPMEPWFGNNCIGIDCGSAYPATKHYRNIGRLGCLRLDDGELFYSNMAA